MAAKSAAGEKRNKADDTTTNLNRLSIGLNSAMNLARRIVSRHGLRSETTAVSSGKAATRMPENEMMEWGCRQRLV
jgi:hypothetical protein